MTRLILSTGNIASGSPSIVRKPGATRSNLELTNSLRASLLGAQADAAVDLEAEAKAAEAGVANGVHGVHGTNGHATPAKTSSDGADSTDSSLAHGGGRVPLAAWTQKHGDTLYVPRLSWPAEPGDSAVPACFGSGLQEEAAQYETTVKLFFLGATDDALSAEAVAALAAQRAAFAEEALALVLGELGVARVDLLVVAFPGLSFEGDCAVQADRHNAQQGGDDAALVATWAATAEALHDAGKVARLGVAEFGGAKLAAFLDRVRVPPAVDQINLSNCCNVPPPLAALAADRHIDLLVHTDCVDVLPPGTLRDLLGPGPAGAGVLAAADDAIDVDAGAAAEDALRGDITPQWVAKYTAVVRDRGVIESKGYFAGAALQQP